MSVRPRLGVFTMKKAVAAVPPKVLAEYAGSPLLSTAISRLAIAILMYDCKLNDCTSAADFCAALLTFYKIRGVCPFSVDKELLASSLRLDKKPSVVTISPFFMSRLNDVSAARDLVTFTTALSSILVGVTTQIAEQLFASGNGEARIATLMSLLRLLAKKPPMTAPLYSGQGSSAHYNIAMLAYGFNELRGVVLWTTAFHFLCSPTLYAQLYDAFADEFEFFGQDNLKLVEEIEQRLLFREAISVLAPLPEGSAKLYAFSAAESKERYEKLYAYYACYSCGQLKKGGVRLTELVHASLPELIADSIASYAGRFSRMFSPAFDGVLESADSRVLALELQGFVDGLKKLKPAKPREPAYLRAFKEGAKKAKEMAKAPIE